MTRINWVVWSGEGERGTREIRRATLQGIKRILTVERCGGDRWAHACPAHMVQADYCHAAKDYELSRADEADMIRAAREQA